MTTFTDIGTIEEKAAAWDRFLRAQEASTGEAAMEAWLWLRRMVDAREAA